MRLCFYNPHAVNNLLGTTLISQLAQIVGIKKTELKKHNLKHEYLLNYLRDKYNTAIVVDGAGTSLSTVLDEIPILRNTYFVYELVSVVEIYVWCLLNGINPLKQTIIFDVNKLNEKTDILFSYACCTEMFLNRNRLKKSIIKSFVGKKILHGSHFYGLTGNVAENVRFTDTRYMTAEADLKKSSYFNKFFGFIKETYILPNVLRDRYVKTKDFDERKNICLALGTLVINPEGDAVNRDHYNFFKINTLHPMRKIVYENKENLTGVINCLINFHNEKRIEVQNKFGFYNKYNIFKILYDLFFLSEGKGYHSVNIVEKYNEYKMFISPEENIGLPSVNFSEGMACGCAYIGLDHSMYRDLGMVDKKNYIAYDGTLDDLKKKIIYYQKHPKLLKAIADRGYRFAKERFSKERVMKDFWDYLNHV